MKKRIRVHEARVGMFVEEFEQKVSLSDEIPARFLISSRVDLDKVYSSNVFSLLIDTAKGVDVVQGTDFARFKEGVRDGLLCSFSHEEIEYAEKTIEDAQPLMRDILSQARMNGIVRVEQAVDVVEKIMVSATDNAPALIAVSRLKTHDQSTYLHSLAVCTLMVSFGRRLGFDDETVRAYGLGGILHDIGKMTVPQGILTKPGALTPQEMAILRSHPRRGHTLLSRLDGISKTVLDICLYHHEHFGGGGYPVNLSGEAIPLAARIAAICDVYDAMTTVRPYKEAWSQADTIAMMYGSAGHFDPKLLELFVSRLVASGRV